MAKTKNAPFQTSSFFSGALLVIYLCLGFIPNLQAVDKIAPQWLALSGLNLISFIFIIKNQNSFSFAITSIITSWLSIIYIGFILWAGLSYFYAINSTEVIVNITRQVNVMFMVFIMGILLFQLQKKIMFISWTIAFILIIEVYAVIIDAYEMVKTSGFINSGILKGVTANRNITAFSLAIKIPFVLFLLHVISKRYVKAVLILLILFMLQNLIVIYNQ